LFEAIWENTQNDSKNQEKYSIFAKFSSICFRFSIFIIIFASYFKITLTTNKQY